jgi:hypothetical protein
VVTKLRAILEPALAQAATFAATADLVEVDKHPTTIKRSKNSILQ